jgi:putative membrane protein
MMPAALSLAGVLILAALWLGPLPRLAQHSFSAHMTLHMGVVAVAAPVLALALTRRPHPRLRLTWLAAPIAASVIEMIVVWGWHAPVLHHAARHHGWVLALEQGSFLIVGLLLWVTALGGDPRRDRGHAGAGVVALLLTSMHMTLLGVLFALSNRPLFQHAIDAGRALAEQHQGGAIMLIAGGASYLVGGVCLTARMLCATPVILSGHERVERNSLS